MYVFTYVKEKVARMISEYLRTADNLVMLCYVDKKHLTTFNHEANCQSLVSHHLVVSAPGNGPEQREVCRAEDSSSGDNCGGGDNYEQVWRLSLCVHCLPCL